MRGYSLRGGAGAFGMGSTTPAAFDLGAILAQAFGATPAPGQALTLDALLMPIASTPQGQQFVDATLNSFLDNPQLADYMQKRAIAVVWDRYKVQVILGTLAVLGLAFWIGYQQGQGAQNEQGRN